MRLDLDVKPRELGYGGFALSFAGTDSLLDLRNAVSDVIRNLLDRKRTVYGARLYRADRAAALAAIREYRTELTLARYVVLEGHSLGGAIAIQTGFELLYGWGLRYVIVRVTAPKPTGSRELVAKVRDYSIGYRHRGDVIPLLPPWTPNIPLVLFGRETWPWKAHAVRSYRGILGPRH